MVRATSKALGEGELVAKVFHLLWLWWWDLGWFGGDLRGSWSPAWQHRQGIRASLSRGMRARSQPPQRMGTSSALLGPVLLPEHPLPGGLWWPGDGDAPGHPAQRSHPCPASWVQCHTTRQRGALEAGAVISRHPAISSPLFKPPSLSAGPGVPPEQPYTCTS